MKEIVLASKSLQRRQLLEMLGLKFKVVPSGYAENHDLSVGPYELAKSLSLEKARAVGCRYKNALIVAADTFGLYQGSILGKPRTAAEAKAMLSALSGNAHSVVTGFTVLDAETGRALSRTRDTLVYFRKLTSEEIERYVASGEPLGKAGAYAIQGLGSVLIEKIDGDYFNVVGLPVGDVAEALKEFGVHVL